ncbi:hypothetical protein E2320_014243 [Naja naja]|nr:hypothetical protein E2320_014243 [Naja naja]
MGKAYVGREEGCIAEIQQEDLGAHEQENDGCKEPFQEINQKKEERLKEREKPVKKRKKEKNQSKKQGRKKINPHCIQIQQQSWKGRRKEKTLGKRREVFKDTGDQIRQRPLQPLLNTLGSCAHRNTLKKKEIQFQNGGKVETNGYSRNFTS